MICIWSFFCSSFVRSFVSSSVLCNVFNLSSLHVLRHWTTATWSYAPPPPPPTLPHTHTTYIQSIHTYNLYLTHLPILLTGSSSTEPPPSPAYGTYAYILFSSIPCHIALCHIVIYKYHISGNIPYSIFHTPYVGGLQRCQQHATRDDLGDHVSCNPRARRAPAKKTKSQSSLPLRSYLT
ncbi:uncharacterized protein F4812DRAFT_396852 [Daldinia caldariorum]|uniref:uncharacterized protein n=1 Tax=Daldinia caldariorum TaxID=326644 RepID=UPI002008A1A8|nr:uncharacterized protein F4812DRAFT_396852 [Daldinia caldariorum]KAI1467441.1 hypothetical protein F4812DRAFT_396852 [Daldinia caldariorum]